MKIFKLPLGIKAILYFSIYLGIIFCPQVNLYSQPCSDLFISEVLFGIEIPHIDNKRNHAVELYNPTKQTIDLSDYVIKLTKSDNASITILLTGYLDPKTTFVLSNDGAVDAISLATNQSSGDLKFDDVVVLELIKSGVDVGGVIDRIGNEGIGINLNEIDMDSLSDTLYVANLNINMGSLKNLDIRRDALIQEGKSVFESNKKFFNEWALFAGFEFENLGVHECACAQPVFFFYPSSFTEPEMYYVEGSGPATWQVRVTEPLPVDVIIGLNPSVQHFTVPPGIPGASGNDYTWGYDINNNLGEVTWVAGTESQYFEFYAQFTLDNMEEGFEGTEAWLTMDDDNGTGATISTTGLWFDLIIYDPLSSVKTPVLTDLKIFPTLITSLSSEIQWKTTQVDKIESVRVLYSDGRIIIEKDCKSCTRIDMPSLAQAGIYYIQFTTKEGILTKKILKI